MRLNFRGVESTVMNKYLGSDFEPTIGLEPHPLITNQVLCQLSYGWHSMPFYITRVDDLLRRIAGNEGQKPDSL